MRIDTALIPAQTQAALRTALKALVDEVFSDPAVDAEYQTWLSKRKENRIEVQNLPGLRRDS